MSNVVFEPQSWKKSGGVFTQEGADVSAKVAATLGQMSVDALGCAKGGHLADVALTLVLPPLLETFTETIQGIATGLGATGDLMTTTGIAYEQTEAANTETAAGAANG